MIGDLETSCLSLLSRLINYAPLELLIRIRSEAYLAEGISSLYLENYLLNISPQAYF